MAVETAPSADAGGACHASSAAKTAPDFAPNLPDYRESAPADDDDSASEAEAERNAWLQYQTSVSETLSRSSDPRDWAFAVIAVAPHLDRSAQRSALLAHAVQAAPDDVVVQWIGARAAADPDDAARRAAAARLQHLEPGNAAVYVDDLSAAVRRGDDAAIDKSLAAMAMASRFDMHYAPMLEGLSQVFSRHPRPTLARDRELESDNPVAPGSLPFSDALAAISALTLPSFQHLINACRARGTDVSPRAADCAAVARLMVHSDTLIGNRLGYAMLRVSRTQTADDETAARTDDWAYHSYLELLRDDNRTPDIFAYQQAWVDTGSELAAMRRTLEANGISLEPSDDWSDDRSPFSAERLASDAEWLTSHPAAK